MKPPSLLISSGAQSIGVNEAWLSGVELIGLLTLSVNAVVLTTALR